MYAQIENPHNSSRGPGRFTVLVAEDNADDEVLTLRALARCSVPIKIKVVHDGQEALDSILGNGSESETEWPQLILLDVKLPKLNGLEVVKALKADPLARAIPVVCLTSSDEAVDLDNAYRLGVNGFVRKPTDYHEYLKVVAATANWWLQFNRLPPAQDLMGSSSFLPLAARALLS